MAGNISALPSTWGASPCSWAFDEAGNLMFEPPPLLELPLPVVLAEPPVGSSPLKLRQIMASVAQTLVHRRSSIGTLSLPT